MSIYPEIILQVCENMTKSNLGNEKINQFYRALFKQLYGAWLASMIYLNYYKNNNNNVSDQFVMQAIQGVFPENFSEIKDVVRIIKNAKKLFPVKPVSHAELFYTSFKTPKDAYEGIEKACKEITNQEKKAINSCYLSLSLVQQISNLSAYTHITCEAFAEICSEKFLSTVVVNPAPNNVAKQQKGSLQQSMDSKSMLLPRPSVSSPASHLVSTKKEDGKATGAENKDIISAVHRPSVSAPTSLVHKADAKESQQPATSDTATESESLNIAESIPSMQARPSVSCPGMYTVSSPVPFFSQSMSTASANTGSDVAPVIGSKNNGADAKKVL